jgi:uncharacterized repeat protein (TIGR02543 family)
MNNQVANAPTALSTNTFTRTGYSFSGWNTAANGSGTSYANGATYNFSTDVTLYAQWTALPNHTVTFNSNGGTGTMNNQVANVPTALSTNTFTRKGYLFNGWNTAANGSGTSYTNGATYNFSADVTLYAQWVEKHDDVVVYRRASGGAYWLYYNYATASYDHLISVGDGGTTQACYAAPMDFDGDGIDEPTQLCGGGWHFFESNGSFVKSIYAYMQPGDIPVPGDYDGDGKDDVVVYRRAAGGSYFLFYNFGTGSFDHLVSVGDGGTSAPCYLAAIDFDGDGADELSHLCGGGWHFFNQDGSFVKSIYAYMTVGDRPLVGDYDGNGTEDVAVYRRAVGGSYVLYYNFGTGSFDHLVSVGDSGTSAMCYPAAMDFDGDGADELSHLCGGGWHFFNQDGSFVKSIYVYMAVGDKPAPGEYDGQ